MENAIRKVEYKLYPQVYQVESLMALLVHHHQLYNWALKDRISTYRDYSYSLNFSEQCKINTLFRSSRKANNIFNTNAQSEQVTLKRVALAFDGFFRRLKLNKGKAGFPRFKPFQRFKGWGYKAHGDGWKLHLKEKKHGAVYLADVGIVKIRGKARNKGGIPKTAEIIRKADGWYLSVSMAYEAIERESGTKALGLDWGVTDYFTVIDQDDNVRSIDNPRFFKQSRERLTQLQRDFALAPKGSRAKKQVKHQIALLHQKIARQRLDYAHKITSDLVKDSALLAAEKLTPKNMTRSAKGTIEKPGKKVKQKAGLNREILNVIPAKTMNLLICKAAEAGNEFVEVPTKQVKPSQSCPNCTRQRKKLLSERWHSCPCGCELPRDVASAKVNLNWALGIQAGNSPSKTT